MSENTTQLDFVKERMQLSKQYPELDWCEFVLVFDLSWKYFEALQTSDISKGVQLADFVKSFAVLAIQLKKCQN